jgi:hypothetical protein
MNEFDVYLLGDADVVCSYLARRLGWKLDDPAEGDDSEPEFVPPNIYRFRGAVHETREERAARIEREAAEMVTEREEQMAVQAGEAGEEGDAAAE